MFPSLCCPFCSICKFNNSWSCLQLLLIGKQRRLRVFIFFISYIVTANLMTKAWSSVSKSCYCFMTSLKLRMPRCGMLYYLLLKQQSLILDLWGWLWILNRLIGDDHMYSCYVILYNLSFLTISTNVILGFPLSLFIPST